MYRPEAFDQPDRAALLAAIAEAPFATVVSQTSGGLEASHLPLLHVEEGGEDRLIGHFAKANPQWQSLEGQAVLAIFQGPQGYVSPGWYASKREHGRVVPTWNYIAVHVHGEARLIKEAAALHDLVSRLTQRFEAPRPEPWAVTDAPMRFTDGMLKGIVGLSIAVSRIEGKWKLSQNRPAADRESVIAGLEAEGAGALAKAMRSAVDKL